MDQDMLEEHLREAKEYFLVFETPKLNMRQFREGIIQFRKLKSLIVLEQLGAAFESDEEFIEYFEPVDLDQDGLVSFEDFHQFLMTQITDDVTTSGNNQIPREESMTVEKLTEFRQLFEDQKRFNKEKQCYTINLVEAQSSLSDKKSILRITLEEFNTFFYDQIKKKIQVLSDSDFSNLISKYEDEVLQSAGIMQQQNMPVFVVHEEEDPYSMTGSGSSNPSVVGRGSDNIAFESTSSNDSAEKLAKTRKRSQMVAGGNSSVGGSDEKLQRVQIDANNQGSERASKQVYIDFMSRDQKDPETILQEIVDDMVDNHKYKAYLYHEEWTQFFGAMKKIVDQICKKTQRIEDDSEQLRYKYAHAYAEKEDYVLKYTELKENYQKLQIDYETLEKDVDELFKIEKKFNEMKEKQKELLDKLDKKEMKIAKQKPRIYQLESENEALKANREELEDRLFDAEIEIQNIRELFRQAGGDNIELQKKFINLRSTTRQGTVARTGLGSIRQTTAANVRRVSTKYLEDSHSLGEVEQRYLALINGIVNGKTLEAEENRALSLLTQEYTKNKGLIKEMMEQAEDLVSENDRFFAENEQLFEEVEKRRKINIDDRKIIESLMYEIKKLQNGNEEINDSLAVWEFKYLNQELIQKHSDNDRLRESYVNILANTQKIDELKSFQQRLSRMGTFRQNADFEEDEEEGPYKKQLTNFRKQVSSQDPSRATLGQEFDDQNFNSPSEVQKLVAQRAGQQAISTKVLERADTASVEMQHFNKEDDFYDPLVQKSSSENTIEKQTTVRSEYEEEEKDQVMPLDGGIQSKSKVDIVVKDEPELFSRITLVHQKSADQPQLTKQNTIMRQSQAMEEFVKKEKGKKLKDIMTRASRFTRLTMSMNSSSNPLTQREQSIISCVSKINNFDYLSLRSPANKLYKRVSQFLERQGENKWATVIFSDYMYKIDSQLNKTKRILLATQQNLYQLSLNLSLVVKIPIRDITGMTLIKTSAAMFAVHVNKSYDFLMETIRRTEFIVFIINSFDSNKWPRPDLVQSNGLKLMKKKQEVLEFDPSKQDLSSKNKQLFHNLISTNFLNSLMVGYLDKVSENWFKTWSEKFCVLTNVGLLYYNDPQKRPRNLFPTIDAQIIPISEGMYNRKYVFQMKAFSYDITFACKSKEEYERWTNALGQLQRETEQKKKEIMKKQNVKMSEKGGRDEDDLREVKLLRTNQFKLQK